MGRPGSHIFIVDYCFIICKIEFVNSRNYYLYLDNVLCNMSKINTVFILSDLTNLANQLTLQ